MLFNTQLTLLPYYFARHTCIQSINETSNADLIYVYIASLLQGDIRFADNPTFIEIVQVIVYYISINLLGNMKYLTHVI